MATTVSFLARAVEDARQARRFYARRSVTVAARFMDALDEAVARISANTQAWTPHLHGTRACRLPYHLVYVEEPAGVLVVAVAHDRRRPGWWRRRLP